MEKYIRTHPLQRICSFNVSKFTLWIYDFPHLGLRPNPPLQPENPRRLRWPTSFKASRPESHGGHLPQPLPEAGRMGRFTNSPRWTKTGDLEKKSQMEIWFAPWFFETRRILWWYDGYGEGIGQIQPEQRKHMMMFSQCKSILLANCLNTSLHEQYACKLSKQKLTLSVYNTTQQAGIPLYWFIM